MGDSSLNAWDLLFSFKKCGSFVRFVLSGLIPSRLGFKLLIEQN